MGSHFGAALKPARAPTDEPCAALPPHRVGMRGLHGSRASRRPMTVGLASCRGDYLGLPGVAQSAIPSRRFGRRSADSTPSGARQASPWYGGNGESPS